MFRVRDAMRRGDKVRATKDHIAVANSLEDASLEHLGAMISASSGRGRALVRADLIARGFEETPSSSAPRDPGV